MSENNPVNVTALIRGIDTASRTGQRARNALVARALLTGVAQKVIVDESGVDKGNVSRIAKKVKSLTAAQSKKLLTFDLATVNDSDVSSWSDLAKFAADHLTDTRNNKGAASNPKTAEEKRLDALALVIDAAAGDPAFRAYVADNFQAMVDQRVADIAAAAESSEDIAA